MINIQKASVEDVSAMYGFICELENQTFELEAFESLFVQNLNNPNIHYLLAFENQKAIGLLSCHIQNLLHHCSKVAEIQELFVSPEFRNRKIGQKLLNEAEKIASMAGCSQIEVTTNQRRIDAQRFYATNGFNATSLKFVKVF